MKCSSDYQIRNNNQAFGRRLRIFGSYTDAIKDAILSNKILKNLSQGEQDVYVNVSSRVSTRREIYKKGMDEVQYLCKITKGKEGFWTNLRSVYKPDVILSPDKKYHSEYSVLGFIRRIGENLFESAKKGKKV